MQTAVEAESHCLKRRRVDTTAYKLGENFAFNGLLSDAECPLLAQGGHHDRRNLCPLLGLEDRNPASPLALTTRFHF